MNRSTIEVSRLYDLPLRLPQGAIDAILECHEDKLNHWPDLGLDSLAVAAVGGWSG
jgi:hypothetical protein